MSQHCSSRGNSVNITEVNVHAAWLKTLELKNQSTLRAASFCSISEFYSHHGHHHVICRVLDVFRNKTREITELHKRQQYCWKRNTLPLTTTSF